MVRSVAGAGCRHKLPRVFRSPENMRVALAAAVALAGCMAVAGFSDGGSYALSLGAINGGLFRHVIAFSPGFIVADKTNGTPQFFISHGTEDEILPMEATGQRLARELQRAGYRVTFRRFE